MLYRKNLKNGDELSILGFGCMRLPRQADGTIDEPRATRQVRYAIDHGVNYIDTAWTYHNHESEPFVGRALADGYREKVKLATKLPCYYVKSQAEMEELLNSQLEKLRTDHIDYYLAHALSGDIWDQVEKLGLVEFLDRAKASGRIVNAGFSFHGMRGDFKRIIDAYDWDFCQIQYNYLDEENQAGTEGLEYAAAKGLSVMIMEPLRGGNLTKPAPAAVQKIWDEAPTKRTAAEWALRWVWNHPEVTVVLSGMNEETHIDENLAIADQSLPNSLTEEELRLVKSAGQKYLELMKVGCTGCRYCMPCPNGVDIPACFEFYNLRYLSGNLNEAKFVYVLRLSGFATRGLPSFASRCIQCGQCLDKCPQQIEIPTVLDAVVNELEGPDLEKRVAAAAKIFAPEAE